MQGPDEDVRVRFDKGAEAAAPKRAFIPPPPERTGPVSPNERVLAQVEESMRRLGVEAEPKPAPPPFKPVDISRVNPLSAFAGSAGAALISYVAWEVLQYTIQFYIAHPFNTDMYIVQRISAIVRTVLVGLFALGSGISGVTSIGLFLLGGRTTIAAITGEFRNTGQGASAREDD